MDLKINALLVSILVTAGLLLVLVAPCIEAAHPASSIRSLARFQSFRGGDDGSIETTKTRKTKKKTKTITSTIKEEKKIIEEAMKEKDAAQALGDAIRYVKKFPAKANGFQNSCCTLFLDNNQVSLSKKPIGFSLFLVFIVNEPAHYEQTTPKPMIRLRPSVGPWAPPIGSLPTTTMRAVTATTTMTTMKEVVVEEWKHPNLLFWPITF